MPELCVLRDGAMFLAQPGVPLGWHVAVFGTYEPEVRDIVRAVLPVNGVAVDVGANVGWHTILMAQMVGNGGRVFAAEANPSVRRRLEDNVAINRFRQVEVVPFAMGNNDGSVNFFGPPADDSGSGDGYVVTSCGSDSRAVIHVEMRRLESVLASAAIDRLDLIKIDVEGFEWPVLRGAEKMIAKFRPHIIFEYNADYVHRGEGTPDLMATFFQQHRYRLFAIRRNWSEAITQSSWPACADIWAVPES